MKFTKEEKARLDEIRRKAQAAQKTPETQPAPLNNPPPQPKQRESRLLKTTGEHRAALLLALIAAVFGYLVASTLIGHLSLTEGNWKASAFVYGLYFLFIMGPFSVIYLMVGVFMWMTRGDDA